MEKYIPAPPQHRHWLFITMSVLLIFSAATVDAAWVPGRAESGPLQVILVPAVTGQRDGVTNEGRPLERTGPTYLVLAPGDTVVYRITGDGEMRIRTIPAFGSRLDEPVFRLAVCFGDTCRKFKRRSQVDQELLPVPKRGGTMTGEHEAARLLGEENVLDLELPDGNPVVRIVNRNRNGREIYLRVLFRGGIEQARRRPLRRRRGSDLYAQVDLLRLGYNDNIYLTPKEGTGRESAFFWPVRAEVGYRHRSSRAFNLGIGYRFDGHVYRKSILNESRHRIALEENFKGARDSWLRNLSVGLEQQLRVKYSTFFGRGEDEEMATYSDTGDTVSLATRFNNTALRLRGDLRYALSNRLAAIGSIGWSNQDYHDDFQAYPDIYSLDYDRLDLLFKLSWRVGRTLRFTGSVDYYRKQYDEKWARDAAGDIVETLTADYSKLAYILQGNWGEITGPQLGLEAKHYANTDQYEGYWDYSGTALEAKVGWRWQQGHHCGVSLRRSETDYDRSHVGHNAANPLRHKEIVNLRLDAGYSLQPWLELIGELHYKDYDYNNPTFAYTRTRLIVGLESEF